MKHSIPLSILSEINEIVAENLSWITIQDLSPKIDFATIPNEPNTGLHFRFFSDDLKQQYWVNIKPAERGYGGEHIELYDADQLPRLLKDWIELIIEYSQTQTVFDDPIQKKYEEDFFNRFRMLDEDANYIPFDIPKMLLIESHLNRVKDFIRENRADFISTNEADALVSECDILAEQLPSTPKNTVLRRLSSVYAKIVKNGLTILKKFMVKFGDALVEKLAEKTIDGTTGLFGGAIDQLL